MTHFEYLAMTVSIILGLCVIQLLSNLDRVFAQPRRYWLYSAWVLMLFWTNWAACGPRIIDCCGNTTSATGAAA